MNGDKEEAPDDEVGGDAIPILPGDAIVGMGIPERTEFARLPLVATGTGMVLSVGGGFKVSLSSARIFPVAASMIVCCFKAVQNLL